MEAGVENAGGEALMLLEYAYGFEKNDWPLIGEKEVSENKEYLELIDRRQKGEPVQYIIGYAYFYGRKFFVEKGVLIPRFDSEILANEAVLEAKNRQNARVLDMCSGSGCIGLSVAIEVKDSAVTLSDIETICLETVKKNAKALGAGNIEIVYSNLFLCINGLFDIIAVNPPYISEKEYNRLDSEVREHEPKTALYGGVDGLDFYRAIAKDIPKFLKENGVALLEIGYNQAEAASELFKAAGYKTIRTIKDIAGNDRVISVRK